MCEKHNVNDMRNYLNRIKTPSVNVHGLSMKYVLSPVPVAHDTLFEGLFVHMVDHLIRCQHNKNDTNYQCNVLCGTNPILIKKQLVAKEKEDNDLMTRKVMLTPAPRKSYQ